MKKFYLFMMALLVSLSSMAWTVKFENDQNWSQPYAYCFGGDAGEALGKWPGTKMTKEGNLWTVSCNAGAPEAIIFTAGNNQPQTKNLPFVDGATYTTTGPKDVVIEKSCYLVGPSPLDRGKETAGYVFTKSGDSFTLHIDQAPASFLCKVKYGAEYLTTDESLVSGQTYSLKDISDGGEMDLSGLKNINLTFNDPNKLTVTFGGGDTPEPDPTPETVGYAIHGQITGNSGWESVALTKNADGNWEYTAEFVPGEFGIKVYENSIDNQTDWISGGAKITEANKAYSMTGEGNSSSTLEGKYTFVYNPTAKTVTFVPYQGEITIVKGYALRGTIVTGNWASYNMTEKDGVLSVDLDVVPGKFGIQYLENGSQKGWFSAPDEASASISAAGSYKAAGIGGKNWNSTLSGKYTFSFNPETETLTISSNGENPTPEPDPTPETVGYAIHGQITGNSGWESVALTKNADGNWEYTAEFVPGEFGIKVYENSIDNQTDWISGGAKITEANKAYSMTGEGNSSSTLEGKYTFVYNPTAKTVTFVPYQGEITIVKGYALRGTIVTGDWASYAMTETDGVWTVELSVVPGKFGIQYLENGSQKGWYSAPGDASNKITEGGNYKAAGIGGKNWESTIENQCTFTFNPETEVLTIIEMQSGIDSIEADNDAEVMYYNLQGQRVLNPATGGMYIRVQGNKVTKIAL